MHLFVGNDYSGFETKVISSTKIDSRTPLPPFSAYLLQHLKQNEAKFVWGKIIHQAAEYYLTQNPCISESSEYQSIGQKMYTSFPAIGHDGVTPWVSNLQKISIMLFIQSINLSCRLQSFNFVLADFVLQRSITKNQVDKME